MRKILLYIVLGISFLMLSGCGSKYNGYEIITYNQFEQIKSNKETFPLVIGSSTCSACESYKITMEAFIKKYDVKVYFIDLDALTDEERQKFNLEISFDSTPTTVFYKEGNLTQSYNRLVGAGNIQDVKKIFTQNGYIK